MKRIFLLLACLWVLMSGFQLKSSSIHTIKAIYEKDHLYCEKGKYFFFHRNEEIEFDYLGIKKKMDKSYEISTRDLSVSEDRKITQVFYSDFEDDFIIIFDKSNLESGSIIICRIDFAKLLVKWKAELPSMNP